MRILKIVPDTVVDGPGLRTSIYFAGCKVHCEGCHNPESWDLDGGTEYSNLDILKTIEEYGNKRVTLTGGNPLDQNLYELTSLCCQLKSRGYNTWIYSGYTWEQILENFNIYLDVSPEYVLYYVLLRSIDVLVDGPFINSLKDTSLLYRGSSNQRIIDVQKSLESQTVVLYENNSSTSTDNRIS